MNHRLQKSLIAILVSSSLTLALIGQEADSTPKAEIAFDLKGKVRERNDRYEFFPPSPEKGIAVLVLPGEPRALSSATSPETADKIRDLEGLEMIRYRMVGKCVPHESGKYHIVTSISKMEPLGDGVVEKEEREIVGTLEVRGDPNSDDFLHNSDMIVHDADGLSFRIPAKKFKLKPSGLDYQHAALLNGKSIRMKAYVQFFREMPHRIATVHEFEEVKQ